MRPVTGEAGQLHPVAGGGEMLGEAAHAEGARGVAVEDQHADVAVSAGPCLVTWEHLRHLADPSLADGRAPPCGREATPGGDAQRPAVPGRQVRRAPSTLKRRRSLPLWSVRTSAAVSIVSGSSAWTPTTTLPSLTEA